MAEPSVKAAAGGGRRSLPAIDFADMQGLVRFGHGKLTEACFLLLEVADRDAARRWLQSAPVTSALKTDPPPDDRAAGGVHPRGPRGARRRRRRSIAGFSDEFLAGMAGEASRSRRLGDFGANDPADWAWGGARPRAASSADGLCARRAGSRRGSRRSRAPTGTQAFRVQTRLPTFEMGDVEPFGFADGAEPAAARLGAHARPGDKEHADYVNLIALGEIVLGYPNEYGRYTERPLIDPSARSRARSTCRRPRTCPTGATSGATAAIWCSGSSIRTSAASGSSSTGRRTAMPRSAGAWPRPWSAAPGRARRWCRSPTTGSKASARPRGRRRQPLHLCRRPGRRALPDRRPCPARQPAHRRPAGRHAGPGSRACCACSGSSAARSATT